MPRNVYMCIKTIELPVAGIDKRQTSYTRRHLTWKPNFKRALPFPSDSGNRTIAECVCVCVCVCVYEV